MWIVRDCNFVIDRILLVNSRGLSLVISSTSQRNVRIDMICKNKETLLRRVFAYFLLFASGVYWEFNTFPVLSVKGYIGLFLSKGDSKPIKKSITQQRLRLRTSSTGGGDDFHETKDQLHQWWKGRRDI